MIGLLHGYFLDGSGSNLWTCQIAQAFCRNGDDIILFCQEPKPELYPFIASAFHCKKDKQKKTHQKKTSFAGKAFLYKPEIGDNLPVYIGDKYDTFKKATPMIQLSDESLESYIQSNTQAITSVCKQEPITALIANHTVLMPTIAQRVSSQLNIPFMVVPHGSSLEYAVKKDKRLFHYGEEALQNAQTVFSISPEISERLLTLFPKVPSLRKKLKPISIGVDTTQFQCIAPEKRLERVNQLTTLLRKLPTGKPKALENEFQKKLNDEFSQKHYLSLLKETSHYEGKSPDENLVEKLNAISWKPGQILLSVGRLIAAKGLHTILAALPLAKLEPEFRLIVVGHGPFREVMESFWHYLIQGNADVVGKILRWQSPLEKTDPASYFEYTEKFFAELRKNKKETAYFEKAKQLNKEQVIFTGYLKHQELALLYSCCDAAVFPSLVPEAGPLVFIEAMAAGCLPFGTNQAGIKVNIDTAADVLPKEVTKQMRLNPDPQKFIFDMAAKISDALKVGQRYRTQLNQLAKDRFDWNQIARVLKSG